MSTPSDDLLVQRQLRAAEIALETARRRRFETDEAMRALQLAADMAEAARERDAAEHALALAAAHRRETVAEQKYQHERNHRLALEQQLTALRREESRRDDVTRQLAAERRIRELEGELELVTMHAAAFEYGVRMAALDAFKLVREMTDRVGALLHRAGLGEPTRTAESSQHAPSGQSEEDVAGSPATTVTMLDSQRLDAALERLRASAPQQDDGAQS